MRYSFPAAVALVAVASPAIAQSRPDFSVAAETDHRRRGISWSGGDAALEARATVPLAGGFTLSGTAVTLRDSPRHGGADAGIDIGARYRTTAGIVAIDGGVTGHFFPGGRGDLDYYEIGAGIGTSLGPVSVDAYADYAPSQDAIGGDNLYLGLATLAGIPATPWTLTAGIGRSSGDTDDPVKAARLRPTGGYVDWSIGAEYIVGPVSLGITYRGTDIDRRDATSPFADARNAGDRVVGRAALSF